MWVAATARLCFYRWVRGSPAAASFFLPFLRFMDGTRFMSKGLSLTASIQGAPTHVRLEDMHATAAAAAVTPTEGSTGFRIGDSVFTYIRIFRIPSGGAQDVTNPTQAVAAGHALPGVNHYKL